MFALTRGQDQVAGKPLDSRVEPLLPISRGPFDVLSYIFEICGENDYRTTLKIAVVSRHWRDIVLATPRAWAFVDIENCRHEEVVKLYLERSCPRPLHIFVPSNRDFGLFHHVTDRIRCLSICATHGKSLGEVTFPNVIRLTITGRNVQSQQSMVNSERFPALRRLVSEPLWIYRPTPISLPPLQSLSLVIAGRLEWMYFSTGGKDTLTSLRLIIRGHYVPFEKYFVLPRLQSLEIQCRRRIGGTFPLNLRTPVLTTFIEAEERPYTGVYFHQDLENVRYMRTDRLPPLSLLLKLRVLQLDGPPTVGEAILDMLLEDFALCPELTLIDQVVGQVGKMRERLAEINQSRHIQIRLRTVIRTEDLPGIIPSSCGPGCYVNDTAF